MNAVVNPDVDSGDPTRYIAHVGKPIAIYQICTLLGGY